MAIFEKIVLCANHTNLLVGVWRFGKLKFFETFQNDEQGHSSFTQFLQRTTNTNIYFLVDAPEEDYRLESLPHTRGGDRNALLERKLNQIYRGQAFRTARFLKREKNQAKTDHFLFMALNNTDFFQAWLDIIAAEQAPLAGVYLLSMATQLLVQYLKLDEPHIILTEKLSSGLRQSYLQNGDLRMSRLVPFPNGDLNPSTNFYVAETEKARLYLNSQRYLVQDDTVTVALTSVNQNRTSLNNLVEATQSLNGVNLDLTTTIKSLGLDKEIAVKTPEIIQMSLAAKSSLANSLAMPRLTKYYRLNLIREAIKLATVATLFMGLIFSAFYFYQDFSQQSERNDLLVKTENQQALYQQVAKDFPATPLPSSDLQLAVELSQGIKASQRLPDRTMQIISNAISKAVDIQINRLYWVQSNDANLKDNDVSIGTQSQEKKASIPALPSNELYEIAFVNGEIKRFTGDYRAALNSVNQLAERLKADVNVAYVEILQAPVNVSSYTNLEGSTTDDVEAKQSAALFKLKIILKREGSTL